jgi:crossover junction endodeoxyribonuclease RusA
MPSPVSSNAAEKLRMAHATLERPSTTLAFTVLGVAEPKGSTRTLPAGHVMQKLKKHIPVVIRDFREMAMATITTSDNPDVKKWQAEINRAAWSANQDRPADRRGDFQQGPIELSVRFFLPRPTGLAKSYTGPHLKKPDLDKLVRAVKDALKDVVWKDDSQVIHVDAWKGYAAVGDTPRAEIVIAPWDPPLFAAAGLETPA